MDEEKLKEISDLIVELLMGKNRLYNDSMFKLGEAGLFVRMFDKVERLKNVIWDNPEKFEDEEKQTVIINSLIDLVGYSLA